ncbi:hypothetical protein [Brumimicrobium oceani]|uniref:Gliding motility protein RemB n=1 Tax=Brumimicrobium oceani TaxID=2100725 RepID=A0A2U2XD15_9FLAO|nr:hypothetical protein [Brumimicrobium oceani]PWH85663.1 hypothetical protein DIT68_08490 [Brumimicrobium oceani]
MKATNLILALTLILTSVAWSQEILIPTSSAVKDKAIFAHGTKNIAGNGFFPVSYSEANLKLPTKDTTQNWVMRKLFKEHLVQKSNQDFFFAVDPLLNMSIGQEQLQNTSDYLFQNTRGVQAFGHLKNKLSFYTAFYENQARFLKYQTDYFKDRGEFYPNNPPGLNVQNAVIPGGGRTKPFKVNGFDYASSVSYVRFTPIDKLAIQFGNAPRFYGWGYRSMLLSDNSYNYTNLTIDWEIIKGLTYTFMRGKQLNLTRKVFTDMVEAPYERKGIGVHYLSYSPVPSLVIGLFESTIYLRDNATSSQRVNPYFYQPVIGVNTMVNGTESVNMKNLFGLNFAWQFHPQHMLYGQVVSDDVSNKEYGIQLGYRTGNTFNVKNLNFQLEANVATSNLYAANNERMNYTHFNLPLAHTLGNGFTELLVRANYLFKGVFIDTKIVYYEADQPIDDKSRLFESKQNFSIDNETQVLNANIELGYEFNPATQLRAFINMNYRTSVINFGSDVDYGAVSIGIRTALTNQYFDF